MREVILACLQVAASPLPFLGPAFELFGAIWNLLQQVENSEDQVQVLTECIAQLLVTLDGEYRANRLRDTDTKDALTDLLRLLEEVRAFIQKHRSYNFIKVLIVNDQRMCEIEGYHKRLETAVNAFHISALIRIQDWQIKTDEARQADQKALHARFSNLEANQEFLLEALNFHQNNAMAMLASLKRRIDDKQGSPRELQFYTHAYRTIVTASGQQEDLKLEPWTVSRLDVDFGVVIGSGGFGKVYSGTWNQLKVALKVMKGAVGVTPHPDTMRREVETWSKLRHPNILQFLGANILDEEPFIVMPLIKHGNARNYIQDMPGCDRLKILHDVSLGLVYLHSSNIIHGDIKGVNILIDEGDRALLCDFGLARIKADVNSRTTGEGGFVLGSRNWMAPELLNGGALRKACDIYSFGMTMYEVYTTEIPLGHISPLEFRELVIRQNVRPDRPEKEEAPQLTNEAWSLAEQCWSKEASQRPSVHTICQTLHAIAESRLASKAVIETALTPVSLPSQLPPSPPDSELIQDNGPEKDTEAIEKKPMILTPPSISPLPTSPSLASPSPVSPPAKILSRLPSMSMSRSSSLNSSSSFSAFTLPFKRRPITPTPQPMSNRIYSRTLMLDHLDLPSCVAFSSDSRLMACGTRGGHIQIWDADKGISKITYNAVPPSQSTSPVSSVAFSPVKSSRIVYGMENGVAIMRGSASTTVGGSKEKEKRIWFEGLVSGKRKGVKNISVSADGKRAIGYTTDEKVWTWKLHERSTATSAYTFGSNDGVMNHDDSGELVGSRDPMIPVASQRNLVRVNPSSRVVCSVLDASGKFILTGHADGNVLLSGVETGQQVRRPFVGDEGLPTSTSTSTLSALTPSESSGAGIRGVAIAPDASRVAAANQQGLIRVWEVTTGAVTIMRGSEASLPGGPTAMPNVRVVPLSFTPDGTRIAYPTYIDDRLARIVVQDVTNGSVLSSIECSPNIVPTGAIQALLISTDEKKLVATFEGEMRVIVWVWD